MLSITAKLKTMAIPFLVLVGLTRPQFTGFFPGLPTCYFLINGLDVIVELAHSKIIHASWMMY